MTAAEDLVKAVARENPDVVEICKLLGVVAEVVEWGPHERDAVNATLECLAALPLPPHVLSCLTFAAARVKRWELALRFMTEHGAEAPPSFISRLMNPGNWKILHRWAAHHRLPYCIATAVATLGVRERSWRDALDLARRGERTHGEQFTAGVMVPYLAHGGQWRSAVALVVRGIQKGYFLDYPLVANVMGAAARGHWRACLHIVDVFDRCRLLQELPQPLTRVYNEIARCCPTWYNAVSFLSVLDNSHVAINSAVLSAAIARCEEDQKSDVAVQVYDWGQSRGVLPSNESYAALIRALFAAAEWKRAVEAHSWMRGATEASIHSGLATLLQQADARGLWDVSLRIAGDLVARNDPCPESVTLSVLQACMRGRRWFEALVVGSGIASRLEATIPSTFPSLVVGACIDHWEKCLWAYHEWQRLTPRAMVTAPCTRLAIAACARAHRWDAALRLIDALHGHPTADVGRLGLWAAALSGRWAAAVAFYEKIPPRSRRAEDAAMLRAGATGRWRDAVERAVQSIAGGMRNFKR